MPAERKVRPTLMLLGVVVAPVFVASLFWGFYRYHTSAGHPAKAVTEAHSSASQLKSQQTDAIGEELSNAERAIMFSSAHLDSAPATMTPANPDPIRSFRELIALPPVAPLDSVPAVMTPVDPDRVASFRGRIALPPSTTRKAPGIDPRMIRTIVDRGVVEYASAKTDGDRAKGARLIQTAALMGYPPARDLLARNYPQSEAVRSVVPANDVIRYALGPVMDVAATSEDSKQIFLALGQHFALQGELELFATQILDSLRGDSRPRLSSRVDALLDLLARVPGACGSLARLVPGASNLAEQECSFGENLRKYIGATRPAPAEEESKGRALLMLNQLGER
jgi:hypothetical protein